MDLVSGALGSLATKLLELLHGEYKLQKGVRAQLESLSKELKAIHLALCKVAQVPYDCLDPQVKIWASEVREASYDMEDILDTFLVRVDGGNNNHLAGTHKGKLERLMDKMGKLFNLSKLKARRDIAGAIEDIRMQVDEMAKRRERYRVDYHVASSATIPSIDPRVLTLHTKVSDLVGIEGPRDELINMLSVGDDDDSSEDKMQMVSIVGTGGLGKTTLAKVVYENLTRDMNIQCKAFVSVGQKPNLKKVFRDILLALDKNYYLNKTNFMILDEGQLIEEIQNFLKEKRYFIVIDDVWEVSSWNWIRTALQEKNLGSKIIITTRSCDVAETFCHCYKLKPLPLESSKILFHGRIFGSEKKCPEDFSKVSDKILKKCGGVPLAIITIASLLAHKSDNITEWHEVCNSIGSGLISSSNDMYKDMRKILSLSYYDLPPHMKTCFLYLSIFPEDYEIYKDRLIWRWIVEGFIQSRKKGDDLFEVGEGYFNDLINRSLLQPVDRDSMDGIFTCRVHDMILDLICSLSREANFVSTLDDINKSSGSEKARRLCLKDTTTWPKTGVSQVRSISIFLPSVDSMPSFSFFEMLRVLDLEGCRLKDSGGSKLCVENLIHLRYLGLSGTGLKEVPKGLEKLKFLQVLVMNYNRLISLSILGLRQLMCLRAAYYHPKPGKLVRNLASLQVLDKLVVDEDSAGAVEELGHLVQLKFLFIKIRLQMDEGTCDALINSLGKLARLKLLSITYTKRNFGRLIKWECWSPPPHLGSLIIMKDYSMRTLPKWINPASLPHLTCLNLSVVHTVRSEDIQMLGMLPNLCMLFLEAGHENLLEGPRQMFVVSADMFPRTTMCYIHNFVIVPSMFTPGALPRVEYFHFCLRARDFFSNSGLDFDDLALDHLPLLQEVTFSVHGKTEVSEEEQTKLIEALKQAAELHPKRPRYVIRTEKILLKTDENQENVGM